MEIIYSLLAEHKNKKINIVWPSCIWKSTLVKELINQWVEAIDMDDAIFTSMSQKDKEFMCNTARTHKVGNRVSEYVNTNFAIEKWKPFFSTVVIKQADLLIVLNVDEEEHKKRIKLRNANLKSVKKMSKRLYENIEKSSIPKIHLKID